MSYDPDFHGFGNSDHEKSNSETENPSAVGRDKTHCVSQDDEAGDPYDVGSIDLVLDASTKKFLEPNQSKKKRKKGSMKQKKSGSKRRKKVAIPSSSSSSSSSDDSGSSSSEDEVAPTPEARKEKKSIDEGRPHPLFYAIGRKHDSDPVGGDNEKNPAGSVHRALSYVNGRSRKLKKVNYPTLRVAQQKKKQKKLFAKQTVKNLEEKFGKKQEDKLLRLLEDTIPESVMDKIKKRRGKEKREDFLAIDSMKQIISAADHEITMARICEEHGFQMVQEFEGDDFYSKEALKRVEKLKKNKKSNPQFDPYWNSSSSVQRGTTSKIRGRGRSAFVSYMTPQQSSYDRSFQGRGRGRGRVMPQKPGACHSCGQWGHWQRECPRQSQSIMQNSNTT